MSDGTASTERKKDFMAPAHVVLHDRELYDGAGRQDVGVGEELPAAPVDGLEFAGRLGGLAAAHLHEHA
ncbi:MAG: hypothetical protein K6E40_17015 [Desulfovibrio sp.]|nr:hypothetical protein [Desulfovibrio sp.]